MYFDTHRSTQTDSPLFRSFSRYSFGRHLRVQDAASLSRKIISKARGDQDHGGFRAWVHVAASRGSPEGKKAYRLYMSWIKSSSASAMAIFSADEICGRPPPKRNDILAVYVGLSWMGEKRMSDQGKVLW